MYGTNYMGTIIFQMEVRRYKFRGIVDGLEGEFIAFPFSGTSCRMSVFNLLLVWEDCTGKATWVALHLD
jgi:hypothetical protein